MNVEALTYKNEYKDGVLVQLDETDVVDLKNQLRFVDKDDCPELRKLLEWIVTEWEK
jgi:hypothetical protein